MKQQQELAWGRLDFKERMACKIEKTAFQPPFRISLAGIKVCYDEEREGDEIAMFWHATHPLPAIPELPPMPQIPTTPPVPWGGGVTVVMYGAIPPPINRFLPRLIYLMESSDTICHTSVIASSAKGGEVCPKQ